MLHHVVKTNPFEANPRVERLTYREKVLSCSYCKPNRNENQKRKSKVRGWWMEKNKFFRHISWKLLYDTQFRV